MPTTYYAFVASGPMPVMRRNKPYPDDMCQMRVCWWAWHKQRKQASKATTFITSKLWCIRGITCLCDRCRETTSKARTHCSQRNQADRQHRATCSNQHKAPHHTQNATHTRSCCEATKAMPWSTRSRLHAQAPTQHAQTVTHLDMQPITERQDPAATCRTR